MTPREEFALKQNAARVYDRAFLDIGYGVTISGPNLVGRMTSSLAVKRGDKVLEIGTGSGYQSAYLTYLTDKIFTIEIIAPLAERTRKNYDRLIDAGYTEYHSISTKNADGYYGWEEHAPFDKIIVTAGIDHVPPPLLKQLKNGGVMVIPVGTPGKQAVLRLTKNVGDDGKIRLRVTDVTDTDVVTEVLVGGRVSNHKGINLPGVAVSVPALSEKDEADLRFALSLSVDFIALSFVRDAKDAEPIALFRAEW